MLQKHCWNIYSVLQRVMDQMVQKMRLELIWSKCIEVTLVCIRDPWHHLFHFTDLLPLSHTAC